MDPRALPDNIIRRMAPEDRKRFHVKLPDEREANAQARTESDLQSQVVSWLRQRGYWPRLPGTIDADLWPERGWVIHLHEAKRNPILLDLLLLGHDGRYLEIELKHGDKAPYTSPEQETLCEAHGLPVARSFAEAVRAIEAWEMGE